MSRHWKQVLQTQYNVRSSVVLQAAMTLIVLQAITGQAWAQQFQLDEMTGLNATTMPTGGIPILAPNSMGMPGMPMLTTGGAMPVNTDILAGVGVPVLGQNGGTVPNTSAVPTALPSVGAMPTAAQNVSQQAIDQTASYANTPTVNANTGTMTNSVNGNGNMSAQDSGIAVNGAVSNANLNNNQNANSLVNGGNQNYVNSQSNVQPTIIVPGGGVVAQARQPLLMPNAMLGRKNLMFQWGLQNNPMYGFGGRQNALSWFFQGGLSIPFGKIPDVFRAPANRGYDDARQRDMERERNVFGTPVPETAKAAANVQGRVLGMNAYNFTALPTDKISMPSTLDSGLLGAGGKPFQPKLIATTPAEVFSRPLNTGEKVGVIKVGEEYPYLGHTRSGWKKILLPNGSEGWTNGQFEFLKYDFTEIDTTATEPITLHTGKKALLPSTGKTIK